MIDAYDLCEAIAHYCRKNGYPPRYSMVGLSQEDAWMFMANGIIEVRPIAVGCLPVEVFLTGKGRRMAGEAEKRRRRLR